ncbi:hypothetical protein K7432_015592 [Basidiobolus ranarum]|uniref:Uncharacterized protein n=1 Tax=Basidiobolus ranarum TaxID=34480 RepID=A0ABR2WFY4_9FUNG
MIVYMGRKVAGRFHHSTFLAGGPVLCGGTIAVSHGELRELTNASGHYKPSKQQLEAADRLLKKMGAKGEWSLKRPYDDDDNDDD